MNYLEMKPYEENESNSLTNLEENQNKTLLQNHSEISKFPLLKLIRKIWIDRLLFSLSNK
ncbi:MAG: hypothetical protein K0R77_2072 [Chryseobacterium sp.]|jgi:hypothetical protein|nr:hypothetical protein [Chryseobacterium sp.]